MSADPARAALDAEILAWMREDAWKHDDERFELLALALFAFQFEHCEVYRRFCEGRGRTPATVRHWFEIPAVPTGAWKELELRSFPAERTMHRFRTSGTSTSSRGTLHLDTLELYEASLLPTFRRHVIPDLEGAAAIRVLAPPPDELPDSSLSHMFDLVLRELGDAESGFDVVGGELQTDRLLTHLVEAATAETPITLCGTAFAFVHLIDAMTERGVLLGLSADSRVMETGGFKGRTREMSRPELYAAMKRVLGIPPDRIVNQYGMTELGSQFYDSVLSGPGEPRRKLGPPWARVAVVEPDSGSEAAPGEVGTIVVFDLANTGSVLAVQTSDLGRALFDGFEVIGRDPDAEARGCSIAADELLGEAR